MLKKIKSILLPSDEVLARNKLNNQMLGQIFIHGFMSFPLIAYSSALLFFKIFPPTTQNGRLIYALCAILYVGLIFGAIFGIQFYKYCKSKSPSQNVLSLDEEALNGYLQLSKYQFSPKIIELLRKWKISTDKKQRSKSIIELTEALDKEVALLSNETINNLENSQLHPRTKNNYLRLILELAGSFIEGFDPKHPHQAAGLIKEKLDSKIDPKTIAIYITEALELDVKEKWKQDN